MNRGNFLWGVGGAIIGAVATYFVMEYVYEKEIAEIYGELDKVNSDVETAEEALTNIIGIVGANDILDRENNNYAPQGKQLPIPEFDRNEACLEQEEHMEEAEALIMESLHMQEHGIDLPDSDADEEQTDSEDLESEEDEEMPVVNAYNGIYIIPADEVSTRQIVGLFNHEDCTVEISKVMSVKTELFDEVIDADELYTLIGEDAYNVLFNTDPEVSKQREVIAVRNNQINLDFVITY